MERYICMGCGETFHRPIRVEEDSGERKLVSPCCGEGFRDAVSCRSCGTLLAEGTDEHGLCPACAHGAVERFRDLLRREFTGPEREALNDAFDGVPLTEPERGERKWS